MSTGMDGSKCVKMIYAKHGLLNMILWVKGWDSFFSIGQMGLWGDVVCANHNSHKGPKNRSKRQAEG